ncbi:hypothetical protein CRUP_036245, partial [Coryphaenoides rupestris]
MNTDRCGFEVGDDGTSCRDHDECAVYGACSQTCMNTYGSYRCSCAEGYALQPDMVSCHAKQAQLARDAAGQHPARPVLVVLEVQRQAAVVGVGRAHRLQGRAVELGAGDALRPAHQQQGRAVPGACTQQRGGGEYLRMLFFIEYGNVAKVERCNMDGTNRTRLVTEHMEQPTAMALDLVRKLVYWADAYMDYVDVVDYHGGNRHTIFQGSQVSSIYGLAVFEDYLYLCSRSDPSKGAAGTSELLQIHRFNLTAPPKTLGGLGASRGIRVYHKLAQPKGVIRGLDMNIKSSNEHMVPIEDLVNPRAIDYHAESGH